MAVYVFKDGQKALIDPMHLQSHLDAGWSVNDPDYVAPPPRTVTPPQAIVPPHLSHLEPADAEKAILGEMGIEVVHPEPENAPPPAAEPAPATTTKKKRTRKAK